MKRDVSSHVANCPVNSTSWKYSETFAEGKVGKATFGIGRMWVG